MSFRFRLIVIISALIALTFGIGGTILIATSFTNSLQEEIDGTIDSFETVQNTLVLLNSLGAQNNYEGLSDALKQMEDRDMGGWQAISLKSSEENIYQNSPELFGNYELPIPDNSMCTYVEVADEYGYGIIILGSIFAGEEQLVLKERFDVTSVYNAREEQQKLFLVVYAGVVVIGVLTAIALSYTLTAKLRKLTVAVRQIAGGDLSTRSKLHSHDEFGKLSRDFDMMADKLQENINHLESDMQRKENFMGAFAHELKTPMTSIIGYADLLRQDGLDDRTRLMAADYIFSEGQRLEMLSLKLLDLLLLGKDEHAMKQVNLYTYLQEIEKALSPIYKDKSISLMCKGERAKAVFEPDLVKSLIYNLVDNATKAIEGEGVIVVRANCIPDGVSIQVMDNGRGMEESELTKITEAFYRVDKARSRSQGGAGLGLALCKEIAQLHSGSIRFDSEVDRGTVVTVNLYGKEGKNANT